MADLNHSEHAAGQPPGHLAGILLDTVERDTLSTIGNAARKCTGAYEEGGAVFSDLLRRIWNRRRSRGRVQASLSVRTMDAEGAPIELESEDIGDTGIRLRVFETGLAALMGHREEMPLEIELRDATPAARVDARLVWAYKSAAGATVSGWHFTEFHGDARKAIGEFLKNAPEES